MIITGKDTNGRFYFEAPPSNVFEGDRVNVRGAEVTADAVKKYIGYNLPQDWEGPFWVVTDISSVD